MEWITRPLGEITSYMAKGIPPKYTEEETENTVRVLNQKCNRNFTISYADSRIHDCTQKKVPSDKLLKKGDVLINSTGTGTAGRVAQMMETPIPTTIDGHMILLRPSKEMDAFYYGYAVKAHQAQIETLAEGSTGQTEINRNRLQTEVMITYPEDKKVQAGIASFLWDIDRKIEVNNNVNKNLSEQAEALLQKAIDEAKDVKISTIGDIADVKGGKRLPKGVSLQTEPNDHPYIRIRDLNESCFVQLTEAFEYVDDETQKIISRYIVSTNDVLISIVGTIGLCSIVHESLNNANLTENCVKLTNLQKVSPEYLYLFVNSQEGQNAIKQGTVGAVQPKLPIKNIQAISIPILSKTDMEKLNGCLKPFFEQISENMAENSRLISLRDSLLPKLMSGELDVSELEI